MTTESTIDIGAEVAAALARGEGVVAIESSLIGGGPPPAALATVAEAAAQIRANGAVPAVIGVLAGRIKIGLSIEEQAALAAAKNALKLGTRDIPYALALGRDGMTTVASTMFCAAKAGIALSITGGMGGVHRGYEASLDASADLDELARTNVAVVCTGAKVVLDLPRTLEYLETRGVPVIGHRTDFFPAYYAASTLRLEQRLDDPRDIARVMAARWDLGLAGGLVIANAVPEEVSLDPVALERSVAAALDDAARQNIAGKAITPFLLKRLLELTEGKAKAAGLAAIRANAAAAARIAVAYAGLRRGRS